MTLQKFNANELSVRLNKMSGNRQLTFGVLCCERLVPNYMAFQAGAGWGDQAGLRKSLDLTWSWLLGEKIEEVEIKNSIARCEKLAPSSDDFDLLLVTAAQDACFAICCALDWLLKEDVGKVVQAANYAIDSIDLYVQEIESMWPEDPGLESKILLHPLMQKELRKQHDQLAYLESTPIAGVEAVKEVKRMYGALREGNLDLYGYNPAQFF